jgi:RNA polymerase sigma factor for flagellar operon FliA
MDIQSLWQQYKETGDRETRNKLICYYMPVVKITAGRLKSMLTTSRVDREDLISYGIFGLIDAIDRYDLDKNVKFETYAQLRIKGSMIDQLRKNDWAPRTLRQKAREIEEAYRTVEGKLGRSADDTEIAEYLGIDSDKLQALLSQLNGLTLVSLEELLENRMEDRAIDCGQDNENNQPESVAEIRALSDELAKAIEGLPERERLVIALYYYEELTYKEIGRVMNISESRVSQLHSKAVLRLKNRMQHC